MTGGGKIPREDLLEVPAGQGVLALEKEGPGELEADPNEVRPLNQQFAEGSDGAIQQRLAVRLLAARLLRRPERREAEQKERAGLELPAPNQRPQNNQVPPRNGQRPPMPAHLQ